MAGIHIVEEFSGSTEWPNKDGRFDLSDFRRETYLKVEGNKMGSLAVAGTLQPLGTPRPLGGLQSSATSSYLPMFRFVYGSVNFLYFTPSKYF